MSAIEEVVTINHLEHFTFSWGSKQGLIKEPMIRCYFNNGFRLSIADGLDCQEIGHLVLDIVMKTPPAMRQNLPEIFISNVDPELIDDENHLAVSLQNKLIISSNALSCLEVVLFHELAHFMDSSAGAPVGIDWNIYQLADMETFHLSGDVIDENFRNIGGINRQLTPYTMNVTNYAAVNDQEEWAESVSLFLYDLYYPFGFKDLFPNRFKALSELFGMM